jgi:SAM-dependent methyltransferase
MISDGERMPVFADYARCYNLLYRDKDYAGEAAFVLGILKKHGCVPRTLLDLGCGTGRHAVEMTRLGVHVTGVDISETMLNLGQESIHRLDRAAFSVPLPELLLGDARALRLGAQFDAAAGLFHVMSYQNTEDDALAVMETAKKHLKLGGLFFFDFWHGPGVLRNLPERRERELEDDTTHIRRVAEPELRVSDNLVVVNYTVSIRDLQSGQTTELQETHSMRHWFLPELRHLAKHAGFRIVAAGGGLTEQTPGLDDWNAWMLAESGSPK